LNFSRFRSSARICAGIDKKCRHHGGIDPMTAELTVPRKQDRDALAPPFFEDSVGIDVDFLDRPSKLAASGASASRMSSHRWQ
jgi:hypothetical protein